MIKVHFKDVGRSKACWDAECKELDYDWLYEQVRPHLASRYLDFTVAEDVNSGTIWAGFHNVGDFEFEEYVDKGETV